MVHVRTLTGLLPALFLLNACTFDTSGVEVIPGGGSDLGGDLSAPADAAPDGDAAAPDLAPDLPVPADLTADRADTLTVGDLPRDLPDLPVAEAGSPLDMPQADGAPPDLAPDAPAPDLPIPDAAQLQDMLPPDLKPPPDLKLPPDKLMPDQLKPDMSMGPTCYSLFHNVDGYSLCQETPTTCRFFYSHWFWQHSCNYLCGSKKCLAADDTNSGNKCKTKSASCGSLFWNVTCTCSKY